MQPPCPRCDQPDASLLRLVLISEVLRTDETLLVLLADVLQQADLVHLVDEPKTPHVRPQKSTLHTFWRPDADRQ
jgi:hypothetical protein